MDCMGKKKKKVIVFVLAAVLIFGSIGNVSAAGDSQWETPSGISSSNIETAIDDMVADGIRTKTAGVSVVIIKDGRIAFQKGYGMADIKNNIPVNAETTVFEYGSISKLFTWVSMMQLKEQGRLELNQDIRKYLPRDFRLDLRFEKPVTVLDLMNHTAGFDDYILGLLSRKEKNIDLRSALMENKVQQINEPGYVSSYSNYGAGLAGYIVQNVTRQEEYQYIRENIFDRLDMDNVTMNPHPEDSIKVAKSKAYVSERDSLTESYWSYVPMYPAGAANGTAIELAKFAAALMDKESGLFKKSETYNELLSTSYTADEAVAGIAHGFFEYDGECRAYWHNGGTENFSSILAVAPEKDFAVVALANSEAGYDLIEKVAFTCLDKKNATVDTAGKNMPDPEAVVGNYYLQRRCTHGISKLAYLPNLTDVKVRKHSEDEVAVNGVIYRQVEPYVYQSEKDGSKGRFVLENGKPVKFFKLQDYVAVPVSAFIAYGMTYLAGAMWLLCMVCIMVTLIARFLGKLTHKGYKDIDKADRMVGLIFLLWTALVSNLFIIVDRVSNLADLAGIRLQIILNMAIAVLMIAGIWNAIGKKEEICSRWRHFIYYAFIAVTALMLITLGCWGIFNPMS